MVDTKAEIKNLVSDIDTDFVRTIPHYEAGIWKNKADKKAGKPPIAKVIQISKDADLMKTVMSKKIKELARRMANLDLKNTARETAKSDGKKTTPKSKIDLSNIKEIVL